MSTVRVKVKPEIFYWVQSQVNMENLKQSLKDKFGQWLIGEQDPTFRQIEDLSRATHIPLGYFFLNAPPVENNGLIEFRTVDSLELANPSRDLIDTINDMEKIQDWMKDYLKEQSFEKLGYVGSQNENSGISHVVNNIREILEIQKDWYKESTDAWNSFKIIREKLQKIGVIVMMNGVVGSNTHRVLNIDEFRAFTMADDLAPLIFINAQDSHAGRLFSLLHETAHVWYGTNSLFNDKYCILDQNERKCNSIAAELIIPNDLFVQSWNLAKGEDKQEIIKGISNEFNCGMTVVARRALDNRFISPDEYKEYADIARQLFYEKKRTGNSGGDYYNTALTRIDKRLLIALNNSAYEGKTSFTDVYRLTKTTRTTFENLIKKSIGAANE
ncbi:MAG: ImmA/IrrE family metallo-endopeptidase [Dethiosulfatibacter sp.]|nr:ImmA/IrrE family metallo-endopeptidase [Dethiosulfatibacter sp.]